MPFLVSYFKSAEANESVIYSFYFSISRLMRNRDVSGESQVKIFNSFVRRQSFRCDSSLERLIVFHGLRNDLR